MCRVLFSWSACALALAAGCSPPPAPEPSSPPPVSDDPAAVRSELARRDAELAAAREEVADLRRRMGERPPADRNPPPAPDGPGVVARKRLHEGPVTSLAFAPDGSVVASTDARGRVLVSAAADLAPVRDLEAASGTGVRNPAYSVCFSPDGRHVAAGSEDRTVWVWRAADGRLVKRVRGHQDAVEFVALLADGRGLSFDRQGGGLAWSVRGERRELVPDRRLRKAALTPDGGLLVWSDGAKTVYGPTDGAEPAAALGGFADALAVSADGRLVAKGAGGYCVEVWDTRYETRRWAGPGQTGRVHALALTPDGRRLVSLAGGAVAVWDVATGDETYRLGGRAEDGVCRLALAADGRTVAVGDRRGFVTVVRLPEK